MSPLFRLRRYVEDYYSNHSKQTSSWKPHRGEIEFENTTVTENVPEEELKIDIEGKSIFISKVVSQFVDLLFKNGPKEMSFWEMGRNTMSCSRRPKHYIYRYQLSDSNVGVNFKDDSRLVVDGTMKNYQYIDKSGVRDHTKFIISISTSSISIIDKDNKLKTHSNGVLINSKMDDFTEEKMSYIKKVVGE
uniref:Polo kinase n=1 Tax=Strongyloides venezuelensis TaxID=75913 RepID=A0A0K0F210_STRVS